MTEREVELKFRLPRAEDFACLRDDLRWGIRHDPVRQVNHYFDAPDRRLIRSRALLRVREEDARCVMTFKHGVEARPGLFDSLEIEENIDRASLPGILERPQLLLEMPSRAVAELVARFGRPPLVLLGRLENERVERETDGLDLEVDRIVFPDASEAYELEIETEDPPRVEAWIARTLVPLGMHLVPQRLTKLEQLLQWQGP